MSDSPPDFPSEGNLWYDSSFAALFAYLEDYGWVQTNGALGRAQAVIVNSSEPSGAKENDFWFDTVNNVLKIYISGAWYAAAQTTQTSSSGGDNSGASVDVSSTQPTNPESGDLWFNSSNSSLSVFSSGSWFRVDSRVLVTNLTPTSSNAGDFWLNTDNNILSVNNGTSLVAINRIEIPIYDSNNRPTDAVNGDLFFNTDTSLVEVYNNAQWVSSGVPSSDFIEELGKIPSDISNLTDSSGLLSSGANVTTSIDYPNDPSDGDLWFNESVGSLFVYIDGTGWVESSPGGESSGGGASVTTGETAPTSPTNGDLWYDTSVAKLYVYIDGTGWIQTNGGGTNGGGSGTVEVLLDNVEFGARIDSSHGYYFTHSSSAPEIFDASVLSANQPVRIDIDVKLNGLDYYTDPVTERDVHIYWVKMKSPTSNTDTYKQGQHYRACWQQHVTLQRVGHTPAAYETPYRLHKEFGSIDSFGPVAMFDETKYNHQDPDTQLVYRIGSDGKFYAFIPRASDTFLNNYGDGTSASGKIYYTMSARLTYL